MTLSTKLCEGKPLGRGCSCSYTSWFFSTSKAAAPLLPGSAVLVTAGGWTQSCRAQRLSGCLADGSLAQARARSCSRAVFADPSAFPAVCLPSLVETTKTPTFQEPCSSHQNTKREKETRTTPTAHEPSHTTTKQTHIARVSTSHKSTILFGKAVGQESPHSTPECLWKTPPCN